MMNTTKTFVTFLMFSCTLQNFAEEKELSDIKNFRREMREEMQRASAAWDEAMHLINDFSNSFGFNSAHNFSINNSMDFREQDDKVEILISVPEVENSEAIKAYATQNRLKLIVPQRSTLTKIIVDQKSNTITTKIKQQQEQKQNNKKVQTFMFSSSQSVESKSLPFHIDIAERKVEYKEDMLSITLNKSKENKIQKAQPRIITVTTK